MMEDRVSTVMAIAFAHFGEVKAWNAEIHPYERELLERVLLNLLNQGHLAGFSVTLRQSIGWVELIEQLRRQCGRVVVDACLAAPSCRSETTPAFLVPVWAFDHEIEGAPAATAQLLGLDLQLIATPSHDEEIGAHLPGRSGRWLIHARPMF